ncbi:TPA_asm: hypothetical protein [Microviridae sp.]|nr:TPA_asm: hypothetical protein [Microviridae sp.]DAZ92339.1 TPA_asm: hypothetical protein [Microviridae sp.]DAZ92344.1 TPA_asm: hypothetical protein [Microviridae sp.]
MFLRTLSKAGRLRFALVLGPQGIRCTVRLSWSTKRKSSGNYRNGESTSDKSGT